MSPKQIRAALDAMAVESGAKSTAAGGKAATVVQGINGKVVVTTCTMGRATIERKWTVDGRAVAAWAIEQEVRK